MSYKPGVGGVAPRGIDPADYTGKARAPKDDELEYRRRGRKWYARPTTLLSLGALIVILLWLFGVIGH
jgi:hypothetical protein